MYFTVRCITLHRQNYFRFQREIKPQTHIRIAYICSAIVSKNWTIQVLLLLKELHKILVRILRYKRKLTGLDNDYNKNAAAIIVIIPNFKYFFSIALALRRANFINQITGH